LRCNGQLFATPACCYMLLSCLRMLMAACEHFPAVPHGYRRGQACGSWFVVSVQPPGEGIEDEVFVPQGMELGAGVLDCMPLSAPSRVEMMDTGS
jgi:hypothetical protein